jgi:mono/diheme cytochrome c family protein
LLTLAACTADPDPNTPGGMVFYGRKWVASRNCASCHDDGTATLAGSLKPVPGQPPGVTAFGGNLTPDLQTGIGAWSDEQLIRAMRFGTDASGETMCAAMPRYGDLGDVEGRAIAAYLRSLDAVARTIPPSVCPERMPDLGVPAPPPDLAVAGDDAF